MAMYGSLPSNRIQAISRNRVIRVEVPVFRKQTFIYSGFWYELQSKIKLGEKNPEVAKGAGSRSRLTNHELCTCLLQYYNITIRLLSIFFIDIKAILQVKNNQTYRRVEAVHIFIVESINFHGYKYIFQNKSRLLTRHVYTMTSSDENSICSSFLVFSSSLRIQFHPQRQFPVEIRVFKG